MATIGLNTLFLVPNQVGGTEYLTREFIAALAADRTHTYVLFCNRENESTFSISTPTMYKVVCPVDGGNRLGRIFYEQYQLDSVLRAHRCDLIHSFGYIGPILTSCTSVVTVHDTNWLDHPRDFPVASRILTDVLMRGTIARAHAVITDSTFARKRLIKHFPTISDKLHTVLPIVQTQQLHREVGSLPKELEGKRFLLCVSAMYPHKRIPYLLKLWHALHASDPTLFLVLVGHNGLDESAVKRKLAGTPNCLQFDKVSFATLKALYHHARLFVHPSVYEGFGYPVYEAYACGLPQLVGDASMYELPVRSDVQTLSFDPNLDAKTVIQLLTKPSKRAPRALWTPISSIQALLRAYSKALSV